MSFDNAQIITTRAGSTDGLGRTSGADTTVYSGAADVQEQVVTARTQGGDVYRVGEAQAFAPEPTPAKWSDQEQGDDVTVTWPDGTTQAATVAEAPRRIDTRMVLSYQK